MSQLLTLPQAVVFDWDNTLIDSWQAIAAAINHTRQVMGKPMWSMAEMKANCTRAARVSFPEWFGERWQEAYEIYYHQYDNVEIKRLRPLPEAFAVLQKLHLHRIPMVIVSNKKGSYLRREVEILEWKNYFMAIIGAEDAPCDKPARDPVDLALSHTKFTASENVWFIGDSAIDMQCAINSGCTPVLFGSGDEMTTFKNLSEVIDHKALIALLSVLEDYKI